MAWIVVRTLSTRAEAEVIGAALRGFGIEFSIVADDGGGTGPELAFSNGVEVRVREHDVASAQAVIRSPARERSRPDRG